jgi:hypothetical protein
METVNEQLINNLVQSISNNIKRYNNLSIYFVALLFAISLNTTWLIVVFSILLGINLLIYLNSIFKFIQIKR